MSAIVGGLACQRDSFLKTLTTTVVAASKYPLSKKTSGYAIELADTVLFPEGGGQPSDVGTIKVDDRVVAVDSVIRDKLTALHITAEPVPVGAQVELAVDWDRRLDVMQQHTGQHLLSAVLDSYKMPTLSWSMGDMVNYIELERLVEPAVVLEVNARVNQAILDAVPIEVVTPDTAEVNTAKMPDDYDQDKGIVRVVKIGDMDANPCCGTHLKNTAQIQQVALLHQTSIRGGHSRLHFVCGSRVYRYLRQEHAVLKQVGAELAAPLEGLADKAVQLNQKLKELGSRESGLMKELAAVDAARVLRQFTAPPEGQTLLVAVVYRADSDPQYMSVLQKEILTRAKGAAGLDLQKHTVVMINGEAPGGGMVKATGPRSEEVAAGLKSALANIKGGGKGSTFQGKVTKYEKGEVLAALAFLESLQRA